MISVQLCFRMLTADDFFLMADASNSAMQEEESSPMDEGSYDANDESQIAQSIEPSGEASVEASMEVTEFCPFTPSHKCGYYA